VIGQIEKRVDLSDRHPLVRFSHLLDLVTGSHFAFFQNAEIETGPSAGCQ
jgi:hypothetical protein